ncbi:hypothetical protein LIER_07578 [Lithospermum erythrorhizon]|uniref:Uncharacterized protein n=1 Tax=Lithospermum erythrorhizon TaxID=34254 RepID=A0AAV3P9W0_LITER
MKRLKKKLMNITRMTFSRKKNPNPFGENKESRTICLDRMLKTQEDVDEMIRWAKGVRKIGMFVTHLSRKLAKSLLLGEIYDSIRSMWPKATLKELDDEEANSLGFKENSNKKIPLLPWYLDDSTVVEEENVDGGQRMEDVEVRGCMGMDEVEVQGGSEV